MRKQLISTVETILEKDKNICLLLGDIGVFGFKKSFEKYSDRVINCGVLEQAMTSIASGLSISGMIPIVHSIAPFIVERNYEQLKIDFGYQNVCGNFISVGSTNDYKYLGKTHQCPADINILKQIPNFEIVIPGTAQEFDSLFNQSYNDGKPTYYRLSEHKNSCSYDVEFGKANVIKEGSETEATVIVVGNMLDMVLEEYKDKDVNILYYTTLFPFDSQTLSRYYKQNIIVYESYYGSLYKEIINTFQDMPIKLKVKDIANNEYI